MSAKMLKLGVSACLLGEEVRFNAGHCKNSYITNTLNEFCDFVPTCPEAAIGLSIPREAMRLVRQPSGSLELMGSRSGENHTDKMTAFSTSWAKTARELDLDGYIFKKDSPSCGVFRVKEYQQGRMAERRGTGLFANAVITGNPLLPVEEEGRLNDPVLREQFLEQAFAYRRLKEVFRQGWTKNDVIEFHTREKMLLLAHDPNAYRQLGRLVGNIKHMERHSFELSYINIFITGLRVKANKGKHLNTLQHLSGYFKKQLSASAKNELISVFDDFRQGLVPLIVPITLLKHLIRRFDVHYLANQSYLDPHPKSLGLRNYS